MHLDRCLILEGNKEKSFDMHNADEVTLNLYDELKINIKYVDSYITTKIINNTDKHININSLKFRLKVVEINEYKLLMVNPKNSSENVYALDLRNKIKSETISSLFTALIGQEQFSNILIGFLGCKNSNNYFKIVDTKEGKELYAVYDFINYNIEPSSILELERMYIGRTNNYIKLVDDYVRQMGNAISLSKAELMTSSKLESILFIDKPVAESLKYNGKAIKVVIDKKRKYLIDISSEAGKKYIFNTMDRYRDEGKLTLCFNGVNEYIKQVEKFKIFNVYYEINNLIQDINEKFPQVNLSFDDCPIGLTAGRNAILEQKIELNYRKKSIFNRFVIKPDSRSLDFNFITKVVLQKLAAAHKTKFITSNKKAEELLSVITGSLQNVRIDHRDLLDVQEDIEGSSSIIPYLSKDKVFGFYVRGKRYSYIAVFNMSNNHSKFFWDLSNHLEEKIDGTAQELYTNRSLLISDNSIYLRDVKPGDCLLIKKAI